MQHKFLQFLINSSPNQAKEPSLTMELAIYYHLQHVTPPTNADNLSAAGMQPMNDSRSNNHHDSSKIKAMLRKAKGKASTSTSGLGLKPPYPVEIATNNYPPRYVVPQFQKFDGTLGARDVFP